MDDFTVTVEIDGARIDHVDDCTCEVCTFIAQIRPEITAKLAAKYERTMQKRTAQIRQRSKVVESGCWEWQGALTPDGYGHVAWLDISQLAHRCSYTLLVGPIPEGLQIDHMCRNRKCVNPDHLQAVTAELNLENKDPQTARGPRNVYWEEKDQRWHVRLWKRGVIYHGGVFEKQEDAIEAAVHLRNEHRTNNLVDRMNTPGPIA